MMDKIQIGMVIVWLACAAGLIKLWGRNGLICVGIMLSTIMALGIFPPHHRPVFSGADERGDPVTEADRARAKEVLGGVDDDIPAGTRVLARGIVRVRLPDGRTVTARTRKIQP